MKTANLAAWDETLPEGGWRRWAPRDEISPALAAGDGNLHTNGAGVEYAFGGWVRTIDQVEPGAAYDVEARASFSNIGNPGAAIWLLVYWKGAIEGSQAPEVAPLERVGENEILFRDRVKAPRGADSADIYLLLRWEKKGEVEWHHVVFGPSRETAPSRKVKVTTVYWRPAAEATVEGNVKGVLAALDRAAAASPDIILLPDAITAIGVFADDLDTLADTVPGKIHKEISARAAKYGTYVIYTIYERDGAHIFATSVLVDRHGAVAGKYRKVQPPVHEAMRGFAPGEALSVFETDFGKIGMLICGDTLFPETARVLALRGAEIIFVPIWGGFDEILVARAIENGVWVVTSGYDTRSTIINPLGEIVAETWKRGAGEGTVSAVIDLAEEFRHFYPGRFPGYYKRLRRPALYAPLCDDYRAD